MASPRKQRAGIPPVAIVIALALVVGLAGFWYLDKLSKQPASEPPPLTGPAREYVKYLRFVGADGQSSESPVMQAHTSYLNQDVVEITGNLRNNGDRVLNTVELVCVFRDPYGQVVLRRRVPIVTKKAGGLPPGEARAFRLAFDDIPESWNQAMPEYVIAGIEFQ